MPKYTPEPGEREIEAEEDFEVKEAKKQLEKKRKSPSNAPKPLKEVKYLGDLAPEQYKHLWSKEETATRRNRRLMNVTRRERMGLLYDESMAEARVQEDVADFKAKRAKIRENGNPWKQIRDGMKEENKTEETVLKVVGIIGGVILVGATASGGAYLVKAL